MNWKVCDMNLIQEQIEQLLSEAAKLHRKNELSKEVGPDYFEPGKMEYLDKYDSIYNEGEGILLLRFDARGTRYEGRTEQIEKVRPGELIQIIRDKENIYNSNNFTLLTKSGKNVGNMPAELCNAIAPLYDSELLEIESASVSFVDPISKRSRYAKQAVLFVEMQVRLHLGG
jgi:hypothetical protein